MGALGWKALGTNCYYETFVLVKNGVVVLYRIKKIGDFCNGDTMWEDPTGQQYIGSIEKIKKYILEELYGQKD